MEKPIRSGFRIRIRAPRENLFPLLCPVREEEWIDGWTPAVYRVLKSQSGFVEMDSEFVENSLMKFLFGKPGLTRWVTSRYEPERFTQDFTLHLSDRAVLHRAVRLEELPDGGTLISWGDSLSFHRDAPGSLGRAILRGKLRLFSFYLGSILKYYGEHNRMFRMGPL
ncbi:MAG: hypothetical protein ABIJ95_01470, partial [Pseudomonadota bacterium]